MGDLVLNIYQEGGRVKCHGGTFLAELLLDGSGDLALETDPFLQLLQEVQTWFGTKLGERINPNFGCVIHDFQFEKSSPDDMASLELAMKRNIQENFPQTVDSSVEAAMYDVNNIYLKIRMDMVSIPILANYDDITMIRQAIVGRVGKLEGPAID